MEIPASIIKIINDFFYVHYGMSDVNFYSTHTVEKHGVACWGERPIVYRMADDTMSRIILENSWVSSQVCFVSECWL